MEVVVYMMIVYVSMWFTIKRNSSSVNEAPSVLKTITSSRVMDQTVQHHAFPVIQWNVLFENAERILLVLINKELSHFPELAYVHLNPSCARHTIKLDDSNYVDIINLWETVVIEPSLTQIVSDEEISTLFNNGY